MNYINKLKNKKEAAFVILVAVVVSTLLVSIGSFIAYVAVKELRLSTSSKDSLQAFYAADSAIECALFHDIRFSLSDGPFPRRQSDIDESKVSMFVNCNGKNIPIVILNSDDDSAISEFYVSFERTQQGESEDSAPYAKVIVKKNDIGGINDKTIIQAYGHNKKSGINIVERGIKVTY